MKIISNVIIKMTDNQSLDAEQLQQDRIEKF